VQIQPNLAAEDKLVGISRVPRQGRTSLTKGKTNLSDNSLRQLPNSRAGAVSNWGLPHREGQKKRTPKGPLR